MSAVIEKMRKQVLRHAGSPCGGTAIPLLTLNILRRTGSGVADLAAPAACLVIQGAKELMLGDATLRHESGGCLVISPDVPASGRVSVPDPDTPFVAVGLSLDRKALAGLLPELPPRTGRRRYDTDDARGFAVAPAGLQLLEAWARLIDLLDRPWDIPALAPARLREVHYRLLQGRLGVQVRRLAREDAGASRIHAALDRIRRRFDETLRTRELADSAGMSVASFHRHFREVTATTPLQYQKSLRLHAARRLIAAGKGSSEAAYATGYESPAQFSRDYARFFGVAPSRDGARLAGR